MENFTVYMHIAPNNKRYIGITRTSVNERWGRLGRGYRNQQLFWRAIQKYGWDNFEHIIVAENLSEQDAYKLEIELIAKYKSNIPQYGYNVSTGGENAGAGVHHTLSDETKRKIQESRSWYKHHSEDTKKKIGDGNRGKTRNDDLRKQISESVKKLWENPEYRESRPKHLSDEHKRKLSESHAGRSLSENHKKKISQGNLGKHHSEESRRKISEAVKRQHEIEKELGIKRQYDSEKLGATSGTTWYNNGIENIRIKGECPAGYVKGRLSKKSKGCID